MSTTIEIPAELRRPHPLVSSTRTAASGIKPREDGRLEVGPDRGIAHLIVSREQLRRALLVLQALLAEAKTRGYEAKAVDKGRYGDRAGVAVVIRNHEYTIEISEMLDRVPLSEAEIEEWKRKHNHHRFAWEGEARPPATRGVPNGKLRVSLPSRWNGARCNWTEGPRGGLAQKLPQLFEELERRADEDDLRDAEHARREAEQLREEQERQERELRLRIENARLSRLRVEVETWQLATDSRAYVAALRTRLPELEEEERERVRAWCDWVDDWSSRADPTLNPRRIRGFDDDRDRFFVPPR